MVVYSLGSRRLVCRFGRLRTEDLDCSAHVDTPRFTRLLLPSGRGPVMERCALSTGTAGVAPSRHHRLVMAGSAPVWRLENECETIN